MDSTMPDLFFIGIEMPSVSLCLTLGAYFHVSCRRKNDSTMPLFYWHLSAFSFHCFDI